MKDDYLSSPGYAPSTLMKALMIRVRPGPPNKDTVFFAPPFHGGMEVERGIDPPAIKNGGGWQPQAEKILLDAGFEIQYIGRCRSEGMHFVLPPTKWNYDAAERFFKT